MDRKEIVMKQKTIGNTLGGIVVRMLLYGWVLFVVGYAYGLDKTALINSAVALAVVEAGFWIMTGIEAIWNKKC